VLLSIFFWISPLPALRRALLDADASRVPVLLSCVQVVQSCVWITAGVLLNDKFIWGCNVGGLLAAILQLAVYALIRLRLRALAAAATAKPLEAVAAVDGAAAAAATEPPEAADVGREESDRPNLTLRSGALGALGAPPPPPPAAGASPAADAASVAASAAAAARSVGAVNVPYEARRANPGGRA